MTTPEGSGPGAPPHAKPTATPLTALVVDDEPVARAGLRHLLRDFAWLQVVGEAASGPAAVQAINSQRPDLVFLDIQLPGLSGLQVLEQLNHKPWIVFTTAHAEHAVTAFELGALDYLLKPFGAERLAQALERLRALVGEPAPPALERLTDAWGRGPISRLFLRSGRSILPVAVARVAWFEAVGDYVAVHADGSAPLLHLSLNRLAQRLDPERFVRIHRAHIVNLDHVAAFRRRTDGAVVAELHDGSMLPVSRAKAQALRALVGQPV
jgi:two-component system, LytTR family, response regulator